MDKHDLSDNANIEKAEEESAATVAPEVNPNNEEERKQKEQLRKDLRALITSSDKATIFAHPGLRAVYTALSWTVMGYEAPQGKSFFLASFLFSLSLAFDYGKFSPKTKFRFITRIVGAWWNGIWAGISFMGVVGALTVVSIKGTLYVQVVHYAFLNGFNVKFTTILLLLGVTIFITITDYVSERREWERVTLTEK